MSPLFWSFVLQWSRFGVNAAVFLLAARFLTLAELGAFATAYAPIKLAQGVHKAGIAETVIIKRPTTLRLNTLFGLSLIFGTVLSGILLLAAFSFENSIALTWLCPIPILLGLSSVSDGLLRKQLNLRALALRTAFAQGIAAVVALAAMFGGAGIYTLIIFAVLNTALSAVISIALAKWWPTAIPNVTNMRRALRKVLQISGRDMLNSGILPLAQLSIGLCLGLPAAGAFQIATRMLSMLDALTLSPLRYLALPKFASARNTQDYNHSFRQSLDLSAILACWVWFGVASTTSEILGLAVGPSHTSAATPILQALIPLGLSAALVMPFTQALTARGQTKLVLQRSILAFGLSVAFTLPVLRESSMSITIALSFANLSALCWFLKHALPKLSLENSVLGAIVPPLLSGTAMAVFLAVTSFTLAIDIFVGSALYFTLIGLLSLKLQRRLPT